MPDDEGPPEWISYFKPNVSIQLIDDFSAFPPDKIPEPVLILLLFSECLMSLCFFLFDWSSSLRIAQSPSAHSPSLMP